MQVDLLLPIVMWICIGFAALWLVLSVFSRWRRRAYNLNHAEVGGTAADPDFLKVDHEKRRAAMERGLPAREDEAAGPPTRRLSRIAGYTATLFAVLTLVVAVLKAMTSLDEYTEMASEAATLLTDTDAIGLVLRQYWPGLLIALAVILVQVGKLVSTLRRT